ncbi:hypothetical protein I203_104800 [Kwoniella mangroviensis CBS 8507]|uniref:uncharacterized protein n=1 Tax=Kwoniella mangroviensis CBS 8507 TaxID=1296122 RepID=UPI0030695CD3
MDVDTPTPTVKPTPPPARRREDEPPPEDSHSHSHSHSHSPATAAAHTTPSHIAGPSSEHQAQTQTPLSDRPKRSAKDGYWKMKEAEAKAKAPQNENDEVSPIPQLSHTATTVDNQQDILITPNTSSVPPADTNSNASATPVPSAQPQPQTQSGPKKRGRKRISPPPLMTTKGISLVFRMPPAGPSGSTSASASTPQQAIASGSGAVGDQDSRDSTPDIVGDASLLGEGEGEGSKKKRRAETSLSSSRPTRGRPSPNGTPLTGSPGPSNSNPNGPLSIFAPPPPAEQLPEALQTSTIPTDIADADAIRKEAAAGFESRLRSRAAPGQRRDGGERTGVSASGKDVRVGGTPRTADKANNSGAGNGTATGQGTGGKKKGKGKADVDVPNQDFCSACRGIGRFLCCDGCPRSFHFMCLEPPLRIDELPDEETWYCKKCRAERLKETRETASPTKEKELKPIPMVFKQLSKKVDEENPCQFRLPATLRTYFAGVGTAPRGEYVDAEEARTKYDRKGFQEDRDPFKTRDGKNKPIACYACGGSSLPNHSLTTDPESAWRQIISCDYCTLSWHLDCLDPPLSSMPNSGRKWMCPNHAEQALPRRRTVRNDLETVDIDQRHQPNNGNIVVIPEPDPPKGPPLDYEDLVINRKKFRVPERIIRLDFWEKVQKNGGTLKPNPLLNNPSEEDVEAANLVLSLIEPQFDSQNNGINPEPEQPQNDQSVNDPFPTPSTPTHGNGKPQSTGSGSGGKQPKIVLRMPAGLTPK